MFLFKNITKGKQKENIKRMKFNIFITFLSISYICFTISLGFW